MRDKSKALIERIRKSSAKPKFDVSYFAAIAQDVADEGPQAFVEEVGRLFDPAKKAKAPSTRSKHPLAHDFMVAKDRTYFTKLSDFANAVVEFAQQKYGDSHKVPKKKRSLDRLLDAYSALMSPDELKSLLHAVGEKYARTK